MQIITWQDFEKVELRVGTIVSADIFPEARKPAYIIQVDFGEFGIRKTSAQITDHYQPDELVGKQIVAVINFPDKQIGPIKSQFLLCGFYREDGSVIIVQPERTVPNGAKLG